LSTTHPGMTAMVQLTIVGMLVVAAASYVARAAWKTWFGPSKGCGSACGKCATSAPEPKREGRFPLPQA
jgi:hypothetical protein